MITGAGRGDLEDAMILNTWRLAALMEELEPKSLTMIRSVNSHSEMKTI
jgi:hypothetical protein